jgi:hypothetical protein
MSKSRAKAGLDLEIEPPVMSPVGIRCRNTEFYWKRNMQTPCVASQIIKETGKIHRILDTGIELKGYRASLSNRDQEDLDTNRGAAGQKT